MISRRETRAALAFLLALILACPPAQALVSLNDGHDHIYVTGGVGFGWDSNVFANSDSRSDYTMSSSIVVEYTRRAGWIGVNASVAVQATQYNHFSAENFANPTLSLELTKQTGRTTGSLTVSVAKQSQADAAVNLRSTSWNYNTGLSARYPIEGMYTLSGQVGYSNVKYVGAAQFPELATYTAAADLIRIISSDRDLSLGYRYRHSEDSINTSADDHAATIGLTGKLIRGLNGSLRAGYQIRVPHGIDAYGRTDSTFSSWTASGSATYPINKRLNLTGSVSKDFSTTANDISVDATTITVDAQFALTSHWIFSGSLSGGESRFLGDLGRIEPVLGALSPYRHDHFVSASASADYSLNEHLKLSAVVAWYRNWSNTSFAQFDRKSYNLSLSSRW